MMAAFCKEDDKCLCRMPRGVYSTGIWVGGFCQLNETLTLFKTQKMYIFATLSKRKCCNFLPCSRVDQAGRIQNTKNGTEVCIFAHSNEGARNQRKLCDQRGRKGEDLRGQRTLKMIPWLSERPYIGVPPPPPPSPPSPSHRAECEHRQERPDPQSSAHCCSSTQYLVLNDVQSGVERRACKHHMAFFDFHLLGATTEAIYRQRKWKVRTSMYFIIALSPNKLWNTENFNAPRQNNNRTLGHGAYDMISHSSSSNSEVEMEDFLMNLPWLLSVKLCFGLSTILYCAKLGLRISSSNI